MNQEEEFESKLKEINPTFLIDPKKSDSFDLFFLTLSVIYNDLKGLILLQKLANDRFRIPPPEEYSAQQGELSGLSIQINKIAVSNMQEFLKFLKKESNIISSPKFQLIIKNFPNELKNKWSDIVMVSLGKTPNDTEFTKVLIRIRNNVGFHYDQAEDNLKKGFINKFFNSGKKTLHNLKACYAIGGSMSETRFYYADAAVAEYINTEAQKHDALGEPIEYKEKIEKMTRDMNQVIIPIMNGYINFKTRVSK